MSDKILNIGATFHLKEGLKKVTLIETNSIEDASQYISDKFSAGGGRSIFQPVNNKSWIVMERFYFEIAREDVICITYEVY
ncbi:TPA: hypothetical protein ACGXMX_004915 [Bacillus cereus]